ncbi:seryl-tRNA synthetase [Entomoplasma freundtii]|uniref:Serine--tRNA ligase n=1 Tax=Entomoplasma freundtii TaxID=74700 RepID=A0A2K8NQC9_9MOLU|nr:serine--tRNA ligase [Entomoplasma freundtii]ATZ16045.1 seryl-tRNA synthetase [Entomoplasma freundtii]TDY58086.1 seryl-tRNA synthetase [Entomoplasma freundtii]
MLDVNYIEDHFDEVVTRLNNRGQNYTLALAQVVKENQRRKKYLKEVENLKAKKNQLSKKIADLFKDSKIVAKRQEMTNELKSEISVFDKKIVLLDRRLKAVTEKMFDHLSFIPNLPALDVPFGLDDSENEEIRRINSDAIHHQPTPHWEIAKKLNLVNFEAGTNLSGARFVVYTGQGSKMIRALSNILLDHHLKNGYEEYTVPLIVNAKAMYGTGQLPKFAEDAYQTGHQYLIPTGEVPLTNLHANEILDAKTLPLKLTTSSVCFRQEAGSAGRDTKGTIRLHQFNKVELVKLANPENSMAELETLTQDAEGILNLFNLPYRVVSLCSGDLGFSATKTYDLEVWFPSQNKYREISSCSNCGDFQARNMKIRYRNVQGETQLVHTLNGSGVAIDRLFAAILENYWDGEKLNLPAVMQPYFDGAKFVQ